MWHVNHCVFLSRYVKGIALFDSFGGQLDFIETQ